MSEDMIRRVALAMAVLCAGERSFARTVPVQDTADLTRAIEAAQAGDDIVLANGIYLISTKLHARALATQAAPITVRAAHPKGAHIRSVAPIAFEVTGYYWHFSGLDITGVCLRDTDCEHAFHVVGTGSGFVLRSSRLVDFNAQVKVNADLARHLPSSGLIEENEFLDSHPRHTDNPVAPVNIDNAANWIVRGNSIHDFQKDGSGENSYGAFVKGGAQAPVIERNLIVCARDAASSGAMVGLSLGADGMDANLCPPHWDSAHPCDPEVSDGIIRNNIVLNCAGKGIYLNKAQHSAVLFNTVARTPGVEFHGRSSTGLARGNLMTGKISGTLGGQFIDGGNVIGLASARDLGASFRAPAKVAGYSPNLPASDALVRDDYCGASRGSALDVGALQVSSGNCAYGIDAAPIRASR